MKLFIKYCGILYESNDPPYERVKLLISDQACYMLAAGSLIKQLCPDLLHVTCVAHCLNRVSETVRDCHPVADKFLSNLKEVLRGSRVCKQKYREITNLPPPPKPVITRWTTWLQAAEYSGKYMEEIKLFAQSLKSKCRTVTSLKSLAISQELSDELLSISDYYFLVEATIKLQEQSMRLSDAAILLKECSDRLERLRGLKKPTQKFTSSTEKNPDLEKLILEKDLAFCIRMKFALVVSVDVERSFSMTKKNLTPDRCSFNEENLLYHYIISCNSKFTE